ncbi:MAG TPA: hypothetical protein ENK43_08660 [Planctomycetes bacterium]|nr:hypothetical protein [Planctomycetota bacterium]
MIFSILLCTAFPAQDLMTESVTVLPDRRALSFGEPFTLAVTMTWESDAPMEAPTLTMFEPVDVALVSSKRTAEGRWIREVRIYRARIFRTGQVVLPRIVLRVREDASGIMREVASAPWTFEVSSVLEGSDPFVPEAPSREDLFRLATPSPSVVWILLVGAALIGACAWGVWRGGRSPAGRGSRPTVSPSVRLDGLLAAFLANERAGPSDTVDEVIACLRSEVARRTGAAIESLTDAELERDREIRSGLGSDELAELVDLLRRGSGWRYRGRSPRRAEVRRFALAARNWIESTGAHRTQDEAGS